MTGRPAAPPAAADHAFVVPAFGDSPHLDACLASLAAQAAPSRVVVATSTPSEAMARTAARHGAELRVNPRTRGGIGVDWNFALDQAGARFATLAHQDDVYRPDFLRRTLDLFARRPEGALVFTGADHIDAVGRPAPSRVSLVKRVITGVAMAGSEVATAPRRALLLGFGNPVHCSSVTFDTAAPAFAGFRFAEDLGSNLDWEAWLRLHRRGARFLYARSPLVGRRYHPGTETRAVIADGRRAAEDLRMFQAVWPRPVARALAFAYRAGYAAP